MTILVGEVTRSEGIHGLMRELQIESEELFRVLSDEHKQAIIEEFNSICDDWGEEPVESVEEFPEFVYDEWQEWIDAQVQSTTGLVLEVMEQREQDYIHLTDEAMGSSFHTVVEVNC